MLGFSLRLRGYVPVLLAIATLAGNARTSAEERGSDDLSDPGGTWYSRCSGVTWILTPLEDEIVVRFDRALDAGARDAIAQREGLIETHAFHPGLDVATYRLSDGLGAQAATIRLASHPGVLGATPTVVDQNGDIKHPVPGQLYLQFRPTVSEADGRDRILASGGTVLRAFRTPGLYRIAVPSTNMVEVIESWYTDPDVLMTEPVYLPGVELQSPPNDSLYPDQWPLANTGQLGGFPGADIQAEDAWGIEKGDPDVLIVVIDTGVDLEHPDLAANILPRGNEDWHFGNENESSPDDEYGHGTSCAGVAAAIQNNDIGVSGIAPGCQIMPLRLGSWPVEELGDNADAIYYAASRRDEFDGLVISCSWIVTVGNADIVFQAVFNAWDQDCVLVFAAGNQNSEVRIPAWYPQTIAVGANDRCDERVQPMHCGTDPADCGFIDWGSNFGPKLDVVAPGLCTPSTAILGSGELESDYRWFGGTSSATPLVAGICALILSEKSYLDNEQVRKILRQSAEDLVGDPAEDMPGFDDYMGWGRVNAYQAVEMARGWSDYSNDPMPDPDNGESIAWGDYDGDGDVDGYLTNSSAANRLFRNEGDGTFVDATPSILADPAFSVAAGWADIENDGDLDLYVVNQGSADHLFLNLGGDVFTELGGGPLGDPGSGSAIAWNDFDSDGRVDFFLAKRNEPDRLYHNDGGGSFSDWTLPPLGDPGAATSATWADTDGDGDRDLYVVRSNQPNIHYEAIAGGFMEATVAPLDDTGDGTGAFWADVDDDGDLDVYLTNFFSANRLLRNEGGGSFVDATAGPLGDGGATRAAAWGDIENDGDLDLYLADFTAGNKLLRNDGTAGFVDDTRGPLLGDDRMTTSVSFVDMENDGDLDLYVVNSRDPNRLVRNWRREFPAPSGSSFSPFHRLAIDLEGATGNARDAIGAVVRVVGPSGTQVRHVSGGGGPAQNPFRLHFGLDGASTVDLVEITWPSGFVQSLTNMPADAHIHIVEGQIVETPVSQERPPMVIVRSARPNPFSLQTAIRYVLPQAGLARVTVYGADGRVVRSLVDGWMPPGEHRLTWDARGAQGTRVAPGVYFLTVRAAGQGSSRKLVLAR